MPHFLRVRLLALLVLLSAGPVAAQPRDVYPVRSGPSALSLNGPWSFKYLAGSDLGPEAAFSEPAFAAAAAWKTSAVPGHWELQGFAEPKYGKELAEGIALRVRGRYARPDVPKQSLEGELRLLVHLNGSIEADYDHTPVNGQGMLLEAGLSLVVPTAATEFRWLGAGPFAGYPGKDVLNEFGLYHLNRADLNFQGNRRSVELALLTSPTGMGVALGGTAMDVSVERVSDDTVFSHNAVLSGRGTKFVEPDTAIKAEAARRIAGHFTLLPLAANWPTPLTEWFGPASSTVKIFQPSYHSYDQ